MFINFWDCEDGACGYVGELHTGNLYRIRPSHRRYWIDIREENGIFSITKVMNTSDAQDVKRGEGEVLLSDN